MIIIQGNNYLLKIKRYEKQKDYKPIKTISYETL